MSRLTTPKLGRRSVRAPKRTPRVVSTLKRALRTREEWLRLAAEGSQLGLWYWNEITQSLYWDQKARQIFGVKARGECSIETFYDALHPDDRTRVREIWRYELETGLPYQLEYRALWPDGSVRWIEARGQGFYDKTGKARYMIGVVFDITDRKTIEQERLDLSGRLIRAQEQERRHVAREIHDDICQQFMVLSLKLHLLRDLEIGQDATALVKELSLDFDRASSDLRSLSHRLHSFHLEILGLVPSVGALCADLARAHDLQIGFEHSGVSERVAPELALALFRIVQEAVRNAIKHGKAKRVRVQLQGVESLLLLSVVDNGVGFDSKDAATANGLGLQSMRERVRMLGGRFDLKTRPAVDGTQINAVFPLQELPGQGEAASGPVDGTGSF